jgi:hypothetical protein
VKCACSPWCGGVVPGIFAFHYTLPRLMKGSLWWVDWRRTSSLAVVRT